MSPAAALRESLAILEADQFAAYVVLTDAMRGLVVRCAVDGAVFTLAGDARLDVRRGAPARADARVRIGRDAILDLVDGRLTILEAVEGRRLDLVADVDLLLRLARAQRAFAEGAARSRRIGAVLEAFRGGGPPRQKRRLAM